MVAYLVFAMLRASSDTCKLLDALHDIHTCSKRSIYSNITVTVKCCLASFNFMPLLT